MFLLIAVIIIILFIVSYKFIRDDDLYCLCYSGCLAAFIICIVAIMVLSLVIGFESSTEDKLIKLKEENAKISSQIYENVENYKLYKEEFSKNVSNKDVESFAKTYSILGSDLQKQIEAYGKNKSKIISLQDKLEKLKVYQWLLYFG